MRFLKRLEKAGKNILPRRWHKYFRASRYQLVMERMAPVDLIVHVGAHWAEDAALYESFGAKTVLWIEADPDTFARLTDILSERTGDTRHVAECALVSDAPGEELTFHRFKGDGSSSSVHNSTETYRARFPGHGESGEVITLRTTTLPEILQRHGIDLSPSQRAMLVVDVQGHEMAVLQGLGDGLLPFELCKCEVSRVPMYAGGAMFSDIDAHFKARGYRLASHRPWRVPRHGDVLYVRR
ncbi:MAG: FkbM family methyltransferase [Paracoccaceae bacterium]